jgi:hypothetical protein
LNLKISTHADVRGNDTYNLNLSRKRSKAIRSYLVKQNISAKHVEIDSYGESSPAVLCLAEDCTEEDHRKNRRAEFSLNSTKKVSDSYLAKTQPKQKRSKEKIVPVNNSKYAEVVEKYGDRQLEGLVFKVSVGAYRLNHGLTFSELADLGGIEKMLVGGIMYYYVIDFTTLRIAEDIRQQAIERGIKDAYIAIFYNGEKISFSKFISLAD